MTENTIAQIRALSETLPDNYFFTTDAGQEGEWRYDPTDIASPDNTGAVLVTADGKRIKRIFGSSYVSVKWFGAKGDGTTNDTSAIQNTYDFCKNSGRTLYFEAGTYLVNTLNFNSRVNIIGASTNKVVLKPAANNMTVIEHYDSQDRTVAGYTEFTSRLSNFTINGKDKTGIIGLRTYLTLASHFFQVSITNCDKYGLLAEGTQYSVFDQVICDSNYIGIRLLDDVSYNTGSPNGGGVNNEFRTCTVRYNTVGVMLGRPANPHPFNLNRFTNFISKVNKYTGVYAINTFTTVLTELGSENNALSPIASVSVTNGGAGYTSAPTVTFSAPLTGPTATGTATISGGVVTAITLTNPGTGYDRVPTVTLTGGGASTPATAVAVLFDEYTVEEAIGNINGSPLTITSVIKRSAVHANGSQLSFQNYNHAQRNAYLYAFNFSSFHINGMTGAAILSHADETSSININHGQSGNGSSLVNTEVSQFNSPDYFAQLSVITTPRYVVNKGFLNETSPSKVPEFMPAATNTETVPYVTGSPYGGALETKFFPVVGSLTVNRITLKLRPASFAINDKMYVQCLIKSNVNAVVMVIVGSTTISARFQLHAGKWKRIVMTNKNATASASQNTLRVHPLDTTGAVISICNVACCTNLPETEAELFIRDFQYNPNTQSGRDALYLPAAPVTGTWLTGDVVYNINPADQERLGWICISGGSPGTWKELAGIGSTLKTIRGTASGNGTTTVFSFPHGLGTVPGWIGFANPGSANAADAGVKYVDADATNLHVHTNTPPVAGTNNLIWNLQCRQ